jgi:hypothetical protein
VAELEQIAFLIVGKDRLARDKIGLSNRVGVIFSSLFSIRGDIVQCTEPCKLSLALIVV